MADSEGRIVRNEAADVHFLRSTLHRYLPEKYPNAPPPLGSEGPKRRLPKLTLKSVPRYVAAVAEGVADETISPKEASALLYAVQVFVGAHKVLGPQGVRKLQAVAEAEGVPPSPPCERKERRNRKCQQH